MYEWREWTNEKSEGPEGSNTENGVEFIDLPHFYNYYASWLSALNLRATHLRAVVQCL